MQHYWRHSAAFTGISQIFRERARFIHHIALFGAGVTWTLISLMLRELCSLGSFGGAHLPIWST